MNVHLSPVHSGAQLTPTQAAGAWGQGGTVRGPHPGLASTCCLQSSMSSPSLPLGGVRISLEDCGNWSSLWVRQLMACAHRIPPLVKLSEVFGEPLATNIVFQMGKVGEEGKEGPLAPIGRGGEPSWVMGGSFAWAPSPASPGTLSPVTLVEHSHP